MSDSESLQCLACSQQIKSCDAFLECSDCNYVYHVGACSGVSKPQYSSMRKKTREAWRCQTCSVGRTRSGSKDNPKSATAAGPDVDKEVDIKHVLLDIQAKLTTILDLKTTVENIERSMELLSAKYDEVLATTSRHEQSLKQMNTRIQALESMKHHEILTMKEQLGELEWRNRKLNLEFHGIKPTKDEDLLVKVNDVVQKLNEPVLSKQDIVAIHRLPSRPEKTPGIIVRFANQEMRDKLLEKRHELKKAAPQVFVQENLTKHARALLFEAKRWAKDHNFEYTWHRNGRILVRRKDGEKAWLIKNSGDLEKIPL